MKKFPASLCLFLLFFAAEAFAEKADQLNIFFEGLGTIFLEENSIDRQSENSQLILQKPGGMREVIDTYEGLLPADLRKFDLNADSNAEIIALLRHPDGKDVMPHIYQLNENFKRLYPVQDQSESVPIICREIVLTANDNIPLLCAKNPMVFHDFGPPELYQLEFYRLNGANLELFDRTYSGGDHFNILMNRGAVAFNEVRYLEAIDYYEQAISSSSGEITSKAFIEAIFFLAEARKLSKDFDGALQLYQKIVLEFSQNHRTDQSQKEIELISANLNNIPALSFFIDATILVNSNKWEEALVLIDNRTPATTALEDRFLFMKAEILAAQNRIEEAVATFAQLKENFPDSLLIEEVDNLLQEMQENPEESGGL